MKTRATITSPPPFHGELTLKRAHMRPELITILIQPPFITTPYDLFIALLQIATEEECAAMRAAIASLAHPGPREV